jgi:hypothetical protein
MMFRWIMISLSLATLGIVVLVEYTKYELQQPTVIHDTKLEPVPIIPTPYDGCACSQVALQIAWSFDNQGNDWESDGYRVHRRHIYIWISNGPDSITVGNNRDQASPYDNFGWKPEGFLDRDLIWRAYRRWYDAKALKKEDIHP